MEKIQNIAHSISDLLQDPVTEAKEQASDRVAATTTVNTGNIVQSAVNPGAPMNPSFDNRDPFTAMAYDPMTAHNNLGKLVTIAEPAQWSNTQNRGTRLKFVELPKSLMYPIDMPGHAQAIYFKYVRSGYHICVQVNAAFGCAGSLIIVFHPDTDTLDTVESKTYFGSFTNLPHTILNLATATQADLFIPHISHKDYVRVNSTEAGRVGVYVWTTLKIPDGGPSSLDVTVLGSLIKPNYQCPKPPSSSERMINQGPPDKVFTEIHEGKAKQMKVKRFAHGKFKWSRELINIAEGPGSINLSNRLVTNGAQSLALVGERAVIDPRVAGSKARIKDIVDVLRIPTGSVLSSYQTFEWPLSKNSKDQITTGDVNLTDWANFKQVANSYAFYRGSVVMHLTVFSSAFNRGRLRWCFYPLSGQTLTFNSSKNAINQICDIGLNSEFKMTIPFTSETWMRPITQTLGRFAIFVENKLTYTKACANTIDMVMMMSAGDDFQLYVPTETTYNLQGLTSWGSEMDLVDPLDDSNESIMEANSKSSFINQTTVSAQGEEMASSVGLASTENKGTQDRIIQQNQPKFLNFEMCNVSAMTVSHTLVDNVFGRAARVNNVTYNNNNIGSMTIHFPANSHLSLARFFAYFSGEINLHVVNQSAGFLAVSHTYDQSRTLTDFATSSGSVLIPPNEGMTICAPFYSQFAFRVTTSDHTDIPRDLGKLIYKPEANTGLIIVYLSFRNPNFLFTMPVRKPATTRAMLEDPAQLASIHSWEHAEALAEQYEADSDAIYQRPIVTEQNPLVQYIMKRTGWKRERLLLSGDIESNPGPNQPFPAAGGDTHNQAPSSAMAAPSEVVFRNRGLYKHYGIRHGDWVYHLTSENIADSALNGTATFTKTSSDGWQTAFPIHVDYFTANNLESLVGTSHIFSCDNNCETIIRDLFPGTPWITQSQALALAGGIILCATTLGYVLNH